MWCRRSAVEGQRDQTIQAHNLLLPPLLPPGLLAVLTRRCLEESGQHGESPKNEANSLGDSGMDVGKILDELKAEREQIEEAILSLERLAHGRGRGPGRPPNWMADVATPKRRPPDDLPPAAAAALRVPRPKMVWAVAGTKRPA